ncbi:MAG TPA: hypothetical protein VNB90_02000 [Cytophagaceae bacterium]|jgi:hypothetical protein|nr:hypothetical protein [Cytophagaceae bacterium]
MQNSFEKIVVAVLLVLMGFAFLAFKQSQKRSTAGNYIMIKVIEANNMTGFKSRIVVSDHTGILKTVPLEDFTSKSMDANMPKVTTVLEEWKAQGYKMVGCSATGETVNITTYIFDK